MSGFGWRSPWPQWRTHWHVWHAWPLLAQALLLSWCGLCAIAVGSGYWSNEAWQTWWSAEETDAEQQQQRAQLQTQWRQLQATQDTLQAQRHPSGLPLPAWQALPKPDASTQQAQLLRLAQQHGLQVQTLENLADQSELDAYAAIVRILEATLVSKEKESSSLRLRLSQTQENVKKFFISRSLEFANINSLGG